MSEPFIAEIRIFAGNFAPRGWALCDGTLLSIAQNTALFSLVGTTYGGNGRTDFGLPDLQGRAPMHPGRGPGLTARQVGQRGGSPTTALTEAEVPSHGHQALTGGEPDSVSPVNAVWAEAAASEGQELYGDPASASSAIPDAFSSGGALSHENRQPYLAMNFIIALTGLFPSRS
jgi:microcystin-dependent protein